MKQPVKTPEIKTCHCGAQAKVDRIFGIYGVDTQETFYQVRCLACNYHLTKPMGSRHRAICRWNNRISKPILP